MLEIDQPQATVERVDPNRRRAAAMRATLAALLTLAAFAASAAAGPFSELVIFGDSLSDVGNVSLITDILPLVPTTPGQYYYNGRFSNGPVYAEALASGLGLPALVRSRSGGSNYAHGGAKTTGTDPLIGIAVHDITVQVTDFLDDREEVADPDALYLIYAGANDLIGNPTNISGPVNQLAADIDRLVDAGARQFFVFNLPLLCYTPRYVNSSSFVTYRDATVNFNSSLATMLSGLEASNEALDIFRFDVAALFEEARLNPQLYGLTNVVSPAAPGLQPGASSYNTSLIAANAHQYLFWDDLHPTATVHAILAQRALAELARGDFNWDGVVDAADYVVWRKRQGATYPTSDYAAWRAYFGGSGGGGGGFATESTLGPMVPEPASAILLLIAAVAISMSRRKNVSSRG